MNIFPQDQTFLPMTPGIQVEDNYLAYWLNQVNLRLRREIAWCWFQRTGQADPENGSLPPVVDAAAETLNGSHFAYHKQQFFTSHAATQQLSAQIDLAPPLHSTTPRRGSWAWLADTLHLNTAAQFVLALAVAQRIDAGLAPVIAHCMNDLSRPYVTPALAQHLWDEPLAVVTCLDPAHVLFRFNLLKRNEYGLNWQQPLEALPLLVEMLLYRYQEGIPDTLELIEHTSADSLKREFAEDVKLQIGQLQNNRLGGIQTVPLAGERDVNVKAWAGLIADTLHRPLLNCTHAARLQQVGIEGIACLAWMQGVDVLMPTAWLESACKDDVVNPFANVSELPVRWYVPVSDRLQLKRLDDYGVTPVINLPELEYAQRLTLLQTALGEHAQRLQTAVEECARRFRFQELAWKRILDGVPNQSQLTEKRLFMLCRGESHDQLSQLAQKVEPRFQPHDLILPDNQSQQYIEVLRAMSALTRVHYRWGTAKVWNESGLSVLFCGPPGTGKTMAAEAAANALNMDMYRIDLSQVVNKYIGETEKNLKRIFDAAENSDCILFFDECDALFGKRTEVKDAHDRFANIEVSYLLERMERFKGLAILATNRRKDLDEAFMRRLRYVIEFPIPDAEQREQMWRQGFPEQVDASELDFRFFARQFPFSGGHIRSVIFNSCLQAAAADSRQVPPVGKSGKVVMDDVLVQVKRELQKLNRISSEEQFGVYAGRMRELAL